MAETWRIMFPILLLRTHPHVKTARRAGLGLERSEQLLPHDSVPVLAEIYASGRKSSLCLSRRPSPSELGAGGMTGLRRAKVTLVRHGQGMNRQCLLWSSNNPKTDAVINPLD